MHASDWKERIRIEYLDVIRRIKKAKGRVL